MMKNFGKSQLSAKVMMCLLGGMIFTGSLPSMSSAEEVIPVEKEFMLDEIVVTSSRIDNKKVNMPNSISVVTAEDLKNLKVKNLDEAFIKIPGIYVPRLSGIGSTTSQIAMRGVNAANSTAVMVNGQKINDSYNGSVTWSSIPVDLVERVEVLRGPASSIYGSGAMGGVVNIITKDLNKNTGSVSISYGTHGMQNHRFFYNAAINDRFSMAFNYEKKKTKGYVTDPAISKTYIAGSVENYTNKGKKNYIIGNKGKRQWDENSYGIRAKYKFDDAKSMEISALKNEYEYYYSQPTSYVGHDVVKKYGTYFSTPGEKAMNLYSLNYKDTKNGWNAILGYNDQYKQHDTSISKATDSSKPNTRVFADIYKNFSLSSKDRSVAGIYFSRDKMDAQVYKLSNRFDSDTKNGIESSASARNKSFAAYINNIHDFNDRWKLNLGLRYDRWNSEGKILLPKKTDIIHYPSKSFDYVSPSIALEYKPNETSGAYISWGKAFEAPSMYRMYSSSYSSGIYNIGNPDLKPQKVTNYEIGYKATLNGKSDVALSVFHAEYTDLLYKNNIGMVDGMNASRYENAGKAEANGYELELNHRFNQNMSAFLNYTYQNSRIKECVKDSEKNKLVTAVPKHIFRSGITYNDTKWHSTLLGEYVSKRFGSADNSDVVNEVHGSYDPYFIMNLNIGYHFNKNCDLTFAVNNIFDRGYFNYYNPEGRTFEAVLTYNF